MKKLFVFMVCSVLVLALISLGVKLGVENLLPVDENPIDVENIDVQKKIDVPLICQYPELPTGCESVAATMVLQYYGTDVTSEEFAGSWLDCDENFYYSGDDLYGPDPDEVFAGNPFTYSSYGCFASPIVNAVNNNSTNCKAYKITDRSVKELCDEFIDNNTPVLIWATMNMSAPEEGNSWYLEDGSSFTWSSGEHCLVLVGYSDDCYILNDPMTGNTVAYKKRTIEKRFAEMGRQAVYIQKEQIES